MKKFLSLVLAIVLIMTIGTSNVCAVSYSEYIEKEPNNSLSNANVIYSGYMVSGGLDNYDLDYYKFTITTTTYVGFSSIATGCEVLISLRDANNGNGINADRSNNNGKYTTTLLETLTPGTYYLVLLNDKAGKSSTYTFYIDFKIKIAVPIIS